MRSFVKIGEKAGCALEVDPELEEIDVLRLLRGDRLMPVLPDDDARPRCKCQVRVSGPLGNRDRATFRATVDERRPVEKRIEDPLAVRYWFRVLLDLRRAVKELWDDGEIDLKII